MQIIFLFHVVLLAATKRTVRPLPIRYILCDHWSQYYTNNCQETKDLPLEVYCTAKLTVPREVTSLNLANLPLQTYWQCWCQSWAILLSKSMSILQKVLPNWLTCVGFSDKRIIYSLLAYMPVVVLLGWAAELHHNCSLTPPPERGTGRKYNEKGSRVEEIAQ